MEKTIASFELELNGVKMNVVELNIPGSTAFKVSFSSDRKPIVVARATNADAARFWTSIPEGRQKEAEGVGKLIEEYFKSQRH